MSDIAHTGCRALPPNIDGLPVIAVDIGYSARKATCGVATGNGDEKSYRFGKAIEIVADLCRGNSETVLVLEAVLSTRHDKDGNPCVRGEFETNRGWYWGPGPVTLVAAQRFISELERKIARGTRIWVAEAFLSNNQRHGHKADAALIAHDFWSTKPETIQHRLAPIIATLGGIPPIRVFVHPP